MKVFQHQRALKDPNGNPQRVYVVYQIGDDDGTGYGGAHIVETIDEGYGGLPTKLRGMIELPSVEISRSSYHYLVSCGRDWPLS